MRTRRQIGQFAGRLRWTTLALMIVLLALHVAALAGGRIGYLQVVAAGIQDRTPLYFAAASLPPLFLLVALWRLTEMLKRIEAGDLFSAAVTAKFRAFALFVLLSALLSALLPLLLALAAGLTEGHGAVRLKLDLRDVWTLFAAGLLFLLAHLLDEARRIDDDLREIV
jgi:hypothetical protein